MSGFTDLTKMENSRNCLRRIARHDEQQFSKDSIVNVMERFVKTVKVMDETILVPCRLMDRQVGDSTDIIQTPTKNSTSNQLTLNTFNANGKAHKKRSKNIHEFLSSAELFNLYNMLNSLKNDLLWNRSDIDDDGNEEDEGISRSTSNHGEDNVHTSSSRTELNANSGSASSANSSSSASASSSTSASASSSSSTTASSTTGNTVKGHARRPSTASMTSTTSVSNLSDSESEISNENDSGIESEGNCGNSQKGENQGKAANADKATELARQCRYHLSGLYQCLEQMTEAANYLTARYQSDIGPV